MHYIFLDLLSDFYEFYCLLENVFLIFIVSTLFSCYNTLLEEGKFDSKVWRYKEWNFQVLQLRHDDKTNVKIRNIIATLQEGKIT